MIKMLRVDHRLLHGQVAFSWTGYLGVNCILIANDDCVTNDLRRTTLRLAKPSSCKLIVKGIEESIAALNSGKADKYNLFIVVDNVADAYRLAAGEHTHPHPSNHNINFTDQEEMMLRELIDKNIDVELRMVPSDPVKRL